MVGRRSRRPTPATLIPLETIFSRGHDCNVGVIFGGLGVLFIVSVTWKRANTGARMGGIVISLVFLVLAIGLVEPRSAGTIASGVLAGFTQFVTGLGRFFGMF
jgi:hypothetical protein